MIPLLRYGSGEAESYLAARAVRAQQSGRLVRERVEGLLDDIRRRGYDACVDISRELDGAPPREITAGEIDQAISRCDPLLLDDIRAAVERITDYQRRLLPEDSFWTNPDGGEVGQIIRPLERVGIYVPGGTAAYPSSVMMLACPAKAAGVGEIIMLTPPGDFLCDAVLAAARFSGVDRVFALGGIPAIASMTWGLGMIPRCDKIAGPSNAYVQEAKRQLFGETGIDFLAGPSDILVICDHTANPRWVAADLLGQAEHDVMARSVLVSTHEATAQAVVAELEKQLAVLPKRNIAEVSLQDYGCAFLCADEEEAAVLSNRVAPEHLEIMTENPKNLLPLIRNAGAVFLGPWSPEPLGDYYAGPSHVLPTDGTARFTAATSVDMFLKKSSVIAYDQEAFAKAAESVVRLARSESLEGHARSAALRMGGENG